MGKKWDKVKELQQFLSEEIPMIDYGGCGIAAVVLYDTMISLGYKAKIVFAYCSTWDKEYITNLRSIKQNKNKFRACDHAFVRLGRKYYDTDGGYSLDSLMNDFTGLLELEREQAILSLNDKEWNKCFNRKMFLPEIEKKIGYKIL